MGVKHTIKFEALVSYNGANPAGGGPVEGVRFTVNDVDATAVEHITNMSTSSLVIEYDVTWDTPPAAGDVVRFIYDAEAGEYVDGSGDKIGPQNYILTNCEDTPPSLLSVVAVDQTTIRLTFDAPMTGAPTAGVTWNGLQATPSAGPVDNTATIDYTLINPDLNNIFNNTVITWAYSQTNGDLRATQGGLAVPDISAQTVDVSALPAPGGAVPDAPVIDSVIENNGSLTVNYSHPGPFDYAEFFDGGVSMGQYDNDTDRVKVLPGLNNNQTYNISMKVYVGAQESAFSNTVAGTPISGGAFVPNGAYRDFSGGNVGDRADVDPKTGHDWLVGGSFNNRAKLATWDGQRCVRYRMEVNGGDSNWGGAFNMAIQPQIGDEVWVRFWMWAPLGIVPMAPVAPEGQRKFFRMYSDDRSTRIRQAYPKGSRDITMFCDNDTYNWQQDTTYDAKYPTDRWVNKDNPSGCANAVRVCSIFNNRWTLYEHYMKIEEPEPEGGADTRIFIDGTQVWRDPWVRNLIDKTTIPGYPKPLSYLTLFDHYSNRPTYYCPQQFDVYVRNLAIHIKRNGSSDPGPPNTATVPVDPVTDPGGGTFPVIGTWMP